MFRKDIRCALVAFSIESVCERGSLASGSKSFTRLRLMKRTAVLMICLRCASSCLLLNIEFRMGGDCVDDEERLAEIGLRKTAKF